MTLIITLKVVPQSGKQGFIFDKSGILKCYLKSPAEKGLANKELIKTIALHAKVPQNNVEIISGNIIRVKKISIKTDMTLEKFYECIGLAKQQSLF